MRSRALTETLPRPGVSLLVEEFRCQTHSIANQIGANASHRLWRVSALGHGSDAIEGIGGPGIPSAEGDAATSQPSAPSAPIERSIRSVTMEVVTDSGVGGVKGSVFGTQVMIKADGTQIYPERPMARDKLHDDWMREWRYRGLYPAIGFVRPGEIWIPGTIPTDVPSEVGDAANFFQTYMVGDGTLKTMHEVQVGAQRYPCVLTKQWPNGCFEVTAFKTATQGVAKYTIEEFPTMHKSNIFHTSTGQNIELPECMIRLELLRSNPRAAEVYISGISFLEHLGRASPRASGGAPQRILVDCPQPIRPDVAKQMLQQTMLRMPQPEKPVQIHAHSQVWEHFLSGEVRRSTTNATRLQRCWTVQLGPFASHTIRLMKKSHMSAVMTLIVDDSVLVECCSSDLGGSPDVWRCRFCFVGERQMDFRVYEESKDGWPLESRAEVTKSYQYRHVVEVSYQHRTVDNLIEAALTVDNVPFAQLPSMLQVHEGQHYFAVTPSALKGQFGVEIPKKIAPQDTRGIARQLGSNVVKQAGGWGAIGEATSKTIGDVGASLSQLGLSAWELMFLERGVEASRQQAGYSTNASSELPQARPDQPQPAILGFGESAPSSRVPDLREAFAEPGLISM